MPKNQTKAKSGIVVSGKKTGKSSKTVKDIPNHKKAGLIAMSLGALGVVFGDIGTSPLYAINEIFFGHGGTKIATASVFGSISLVVWALTIIVAIKYLVFVMRADNDGQGGVFALYSLLSVHKQKWVIGALLVVLMFTAGLLFGDGIITPAISVLSAVEGLKVAAPSLGKFVIPITIVILTGLFLIQKQGTEKVGKIFGPIMLVWFFVLGLLGLEQVLLHPEILGVLNPIYAYQFLISNSWHTNLLVMGAVMLTITGGEALYADMGHFGKTPIRISWFSFVYPALILNYLGQGAFLLSGKNIVGDNIFYSMVPSWGTIPMIVLATMATIIASQALISGAFSLTSQAIALGLLPRLKILHTHHAHEGQIYLGFINWALYLGCVLLVISFGSSSALASAYGLAVSGDMMVSSLAMIAVSFFVWKWKIYRSVLFFGLVAIIDLSFLTANSLKFFEGGFIPVSIGVVMFIVMMTWQWGRNATFKSYSDHVTMKIKDLILFKKNEKHVLDKTVVIMSPKPMLTLENNTPALMQFFIDRYGVSPKHLIFLTIEMARIPYNHKNRYEILELQPEKGSGCVTSILVKFGFMEDPDVEAVMLDLARNHHDKIALTAKTSDWLVHASQERFVTGPKTKFFTKLRLKLFTFLRANSQPGYYYYGLGKGGVHLTTDIMPIKIN